jgi:hypothetical protein
MISRDKSSTAVSLGVITVCLELGVHFWKLIPGSWGKHLLGFACGVARIWVSKAADLCNGTNGKIFCSKRKKDEVVES